MSTEYKILNVIRFWLKKLTDTLTKNGIIKNKGL